MFRRTLLALAFVGALGAVGLGLSDTAEARHRCGRGWYGDYYGAYYGGPYPYVYRASYYPPAYYGPPVYYRPRYYNRGGVYFSIGF